MPLRPRRPDLFGPLPDPDIGRAPLPPLAMPTRPPRAWFCLYFPELSLEALPSADAGPRAVIAGEGRHELIVAANATARAAGVRPGLSPGSALALAPALQLQSRDRPAEVALLATVAARCTALTPAVSVDADAVLLEVRASLRLYGGAASMADRMTSLCQGLALTLAAAPTARAALWLARSGQSSLALEWSTPGRALGAIPIVATGWPETVLALLGQAGVRTLGELVRLPRAGLARRIGVSRLRELDEAWGHCPEQRSWHVPATDFHAGCELPGETTAAHHLAVAAQPLFAALAGELARRQAGVRHVWCTFRHAGFAGERPADTRLRIAVRQPSADVTRLHALLALRLGSYRLPAPVVALTLQAPLVGDCPLLTRDWHGGAAAARGRLATVLDRLRARFGPRGVRGLALRSDHRPEQAWCWSEPATAAPAAGMTVSSGRRPPWLLAVPRRLAEAGGLPVCDGVLVLTDGPERIETGWWDGGDIRRDYFVAASSDGRQLWVFRDLHEGGWYLHGVFR